MTDRDISPESSPDTHGVVLTQAESAVKPAATPEPAARQGRFHAYLALWLHRITVLLFVFVCAVVGVLLVILPWRPEWTDNRLMLAYPMLRTLLGNGFARGLCTGLGLLDIWIGFWEAVHYHEEGH